MSQTLEPVIKGVLSVEKKHKGLSGLESERDGEHQSVAHSKRTFPKLPCLVSKDLLSALQQLAAFYRPTLCIFDSFKDPHGLSVSAYDFASATHPLKPASVLNDHLPQISWKMDLAKPLA